MKYIIESPVSDFTFDFVPTSVYIDGVQTFGYSLRDHTAFFDTTLPAGTELTAIPADAIRFEDNNIVTVDIANVGWLSVFSDPFGEIELSLDGVTWVKSLSHTYPATVMLRQAQLPVVTDILCRANIELVIWDGGEGAKINEQGIIELIKDLPVGSSTGGVEYYVH